MNKIKKNMINYYILLSTLIHSSFFLFFVNEKEVTIGEKIIPIEVVDNLLEVGFGEATKRSTKPIMRTSLKEHSQKNQKDKKPSDQEKSIEEREINKKVDKKKFKQKKKIKNNIIQNKSREINGSGSREGKKNNEPEKGSLKGKGKIKITCLKCIRPVYPPIALRRGAEGTPKVKVWINRNGKVIQAELITKSGNKQIDEASFIAAKNSTFYPIQQETTINIEYQLRIK